MQGGERGAGRRRRGKRCRSHVAGCRLDWAAYETRGEVEVFLASVPPHPSPLPWGEGEPPCAEAIVVISLVLVGREEKDQGSPGALTPVELVMLTALGFFPFALAEAGFCQLWLGHWFKIHKVLEVEAIIPPDAAQFGGDRL